LYERLLTFNHTPVIALNHAVAIAMSEGLEQGLQRIDALASGGELDHYYLFHAARADVLNRMQDRQSAADAYRRALELVTNPVEQRFLARKLRLLS
jgi:RNA polymerase sigma-70 factor (ECF subfamily)